MQRMDYDTLHARAFSLLEQLIGENPRNAGVQVLRVRGGLESGAIRRIVVHYIDGKARNRRLRLIAKSLDGRSAREAYVYEQVLEQIGVSVAPALFAVDEHGPEQYALWLEDVPRRSAWPWRNTVATKSVLRSLAHFHESSTEQRAVGLPAWDYDAELQQSSVSTLEMLEMLRGVPELSPAIRRAIGPLRRIVLALPELREQLLLSPDFGCCFIHGDVHAGNVLMRGSRAEPVFIDWARARAGSPLEDVSSWLQSLGHWEADARRQHDTLLASYLASRGREARIWQDLRAMYWVAGACNALAGALKYHCWVLAHANRVAERQQAARLARSWLRTVIRADAFTH